MNRPKSYSTFYKKAITEIKKIWENLLREKQQKDLFKQKKNDGSLVTELDLAISKKVLELQKELLPDHTYYSEEEQVGLNFPAIVIDPIDGTKELARGIPEHCVSIALMLDARLDHSNHFAGLLNLATGSEFNSENMTKFKLPEKKNEQLMGMVSNTEWDSGMYKNYPDLILKPVGSIAYKLQLLSFGLTDYVITLKPKNLWDIAGGTVLLSQLGYKLYHGKDEIKELSQELYQAPLLWCKEADFKQLATSFQF